MPVNLRPGSGYDIAGTSGGGGGGDPVTVSVTPVTVRQTSPGAQVFTATPSGGTAPYTFVWAALYSDGTSANALLSTLSGATTTVTTVNYDTELLINCTVFDSSSPTKDDHDNALLQVLPASNLVAQISPTNAVQASPGAQAFTVTPTGGSGSYTYAWTATQTDGTDANANLSALTGNPVTLTTTNYQQSFRVQCVVTDTNNPSQSATVGAVVSVGQPPALVAPADLAPVQLALGTTSTSFSFGNATGGAPPYSYVMIVQSSNGAATLSTYTGKSGNILNLSDGVTAQVVVQVVDSLGQTADATFVVGVGVVAVFNENALWNYIGGTELTTLGTGSRGTVGSLTVGGVTFNLVYAAGSPTGVGLNIGATGVRLSQVITAGESAAVWWNTNLLSSFTTGEHILVNIIFQTTTMATNFIVIITIGDSTAYNAGNGYGFNINWDASGLITARRITGGTVTTFGIATGQANANKTFSAQILLVAGRLPYLTISQDSNYIGGPRLGLPQPMRGTFTGTPGSQSTSAGATFSPPISSLRMQIGLAGANGNANILRYEVRRLTRAS